MNLKFNDEYIISKNDLSFPNPLNEKDIEWYFTILRDEEIELDQMNQKVYGKQYDDSNADNSEEPC